MDDHEWESDLSIISMITDRTGQHEVLLPINQTNTISGKKIQLGQMSPLRTVSEAKNLEISQFSFQGKWLLLWLL